MKSAHWLLTFVLLAVVPGLGHAAVDCTAREPGLPHECEKGPNAGQACVPDFGAVADPLVCSVSRPSQNDFCLGAKCTMVFAKGATFSAVMTIIADNNVSAFDGSQSIQNAIAVTVIIDLGKRGVLAQTYQNLSGTSLSSLAEAPTDTFGVGIDEGRLASETDIRPDGKAAIVNDLLFRPQDAELSDALRAIFNTTGVPVVTKVTSLALTDRRTDGLATTLRLKVKGGFVTE